MYVYMYILEIACLKARMKTLEVNAECMKRPPSVTPSIRPSCLPLFTASHHKSGTIHDHAN